MPISQIENNRTFAAAKQNGVLGSSASTADIELAVLMNGTIDYSRLNELGWQLVDANVLGLVASEKGYISSSFDPSIGVYVFENKNVTGEFALSYTHISTSKIDEVFPSVMYTIPAFNTVYADDFSAVYVAMNTKFPSISKVLTTGYSLGGVAVNQMSNSFSNHFSEATGVFIAFGSEYIADNQFVFNFGASNDWLFGLYNDYATEFIASDPEINGGTKFYDLLGVSGADVQALDNSSFLNKLFALENRISDAVKTSNFFFDFGENSASAFTFADYKSAHSFSKYLGEAANRLASSTSVADFTNDTKIIFDFNEGRLTVETDSNPFFTSGQATPVYVLGGKLSDDIQGHSGVDVFEGNGGNDTIDGGAGKDTAKYAGDSKHFSITMTKGAATTVMDRSGAEGTDSVTNVENFDFATGKDVNLDILDGVVNVSSADLSAFIEMYIAYFNRAPDAEGLFYWGTRLSEGMSKNEIAESFYVQPETQALYTNPADTNGFVTAVYQNFLGRAPDTDGFNYWVKQLDDGIVSKPIFLLAIINGAKAASGSQTDVDYFTNKANIGAYYSVIKGMSNTDNAKAAMALYNGSAASITAAKNAIDGFYTAALDANSGELLINLVGVMDDPFVV